MEERVVSAALWPGSEIVSLWPGLGIPGALIPTEGDNGGSPLANDNIDPDLEYRMEIITPPSAGVFTVYPNTSILFTDAPDGTYSYVYEGFETGVSYAIVESELRVGVAPTTVSTISATLESATFAGVSFPVPQSIIAASLSGAVFSGIAYPRPNSVIAATLAGAVFSGETYPLGTTLVSISATLDDAVFSGTAFPKPTSVINATLGSAVFSGTTAPVLLVETWPLPSNVLLGISYGPTGTEYIGTLLPGSGTSATAEEIADEIMLRLNTTPIEVTALNIPTVTQTADAVWSKVLP